MAMTPSDSPSAPQQYEAVTPHGRGPAPYDILAPQEDLTAAVNAAGALTGAGIVYPVSARQSEALTMLQSPQGFGSDGYDINTGYHGTWQADVEPDVAGP